MFTHSAEVEIRPQKYHTLQNKTLYISDIFRIHSWDIKSLLDVDKVSQINSESINMSLKMTTKY